MSTEEFAFVGRSLNTGDSGRTLDAARAFRNASALCGGAWNIVTFIDSAVSQTVDCGGYDAISVWHAAGAARNCTLTVDLSTWHSDSREYTADILTLGLGRVHTLAGRQATGTLARAAALRLTAGDKIALVDAAVLGAIRGRQHNAAA